MTYAAWVFVLGWLYFIVHMTYLIKLMSEEKKELLKALKEDVKKLEVNSVNDILSITEPKEEEEVDRDWWE